jgi:hypothetical protein
MGHISMIMDENNLKLQDEEVIDYKCSCKIVTRMAKGAK